MGFISKLTETAMMVTIGYIGLITLTLLGVQFGPLTNKLIGLIVIASLASCYTFYFRL